MHKIKDALMKELYEYEQKMEKERGKISAGDLETIHKLTDTIKNIDKMELMDEEIGYSEDSGWMGEGRVYGTSYARGRGRNAKRDSMGRYSRAGQNNSGGGRGGGENSYRGGSGRYSMDGAAEDLIEKAEELLEMAENEQEKKAVENFIRKLEQM